MTSNTSQKFESFVPVYDALPEKMEDLRPFLVEILKEHANAINTRVIGWLLDEELLSGYQYIPGSNLTGTSEQFRSGLRKVVVTGALAVGVNPPVPHGITFDVNFTLLNLWVAATNSTTFIAQTISNAPAQNTNVLMDATNITITSPSVFDRSITFVEYVQEL